MDLANKSTHNLAPTKMLAQCNYHLYTSGATLRDPIKINNNLNNAPMTL
jgi:hypothetical protein